jgi:hypothetical protein
MTGDLVHNAAPKPGASWRKAVHVATQVRVRKLQREELGNTFNNTHW